MARWRLQQPHYLNVLVDGKPAEWEYKEVDRTTGKSGRKVYPVPLLLDPREPGDYNYPGEIIVAQGKNPNPKDIIFFGPPTPDMEPLDDEAQALTDKEAPKWNHPIDDLPAGGGYAGTLLSGLEKQLAALVANMPAQPAAPVSVAGVSTEDFAKLQEQVATLMARNAELEANAPTKRRSA